MPVMRKIEACSKKWGAPVTGRAAGGTSVKTTMVASDTQEEARRRRTIIGKLNTSGASNVNLFYL